MSAPTLGPLHGDAKLVEGARALLEVAARVAERLPPVEEVLHTGERERYRWASLAQYLRQGLYGEGAGGDLEHPTPGSLLGQLRRMSDWSDERWTDLYQEERAELARDASGPEDREDTSTRRETAR